MAHLQSQISSIAVLYICPCVLTAPLMSYPFWASQLTQSSSHHKTTDRESGVVWLPHLPPAGTRGG